MPKPTRNPHRGCLALTGAAVLIIASALCPAQEPAKAPETSAPSTPAAANPAAQGPASEWTPLDSRILDCVPYVKAKVGDVEAWFMFDTGADTCFDDTWARKNIPSITTDPPGKAELVGRTRVMDATVTVGGESIRVRNSVCFDFRPFNKPRNQPFAGLIGTDFMATRTFRIRYFDGPLGPAGVDLARVERPVLPAGAMRLPLMDDIVRPQLTALAWQGSAAPLGVTVTVDTGLLGTAQIGATCADRMKVILDPGPATGRIGANGKISGHESHDITLDFGAFQARELDAFVESENTRVELLIGGRILRCYQVVLDLPHRMIALTPDAPNRGLGFSISVAFGEVPPEVAAALSQGAASGPPGSVPDTSKLPPAGDLVVHDVAWGSPIFLAGVRNEDRIKAINGLDVEQLGLQHVTEFLSAAGESGGEFSMTLRRGDRVIEVRVPQRQPYKYPAEEK